MLLKNVGKAVTTGTIGGSAGFALGGPAGAAVGSAIGVAIPPSLETIKLMRMAWQMQGGKEMLKGLMANSDGAVTPKVLATLGAFISGQVATRSPQRETSVPTMPSARPNFSVGGTLRPMAPVEESSLTGRLMPEPLGSR